MTADLETLKQNVFRMIIMSRNANLPNSTTEDVRPPLKFNGNARSPYSRSPMAVKKSQPTLVFKDNPLRAYEDLIPSIHQKFRSTSISLPLISPVNIEADPRQSTSPSNAAVVPTQPDTSSLFSTFNNRSPQLFPEFGELLNSAFSFSQTNLDRYSPLIRISESRTPSPPFPTVSLPEPLDEEEREELLSRGPSRLIGFLVTEAMRPETDHIIQWTGRGLEFFIADKEKCANMWGRRKHNSMKMTYDKLARAIREKYQHKNRPQSGQLRKRMSNLRLHIHGESLSRNGKVHKDEDSGHRKIRKEIRYPVS
ncbi:unnamed protein product [Caenorhabditis auriculariae]|uniref:ETS domain-containing protein n=1 Tax=Caenorhabditis auriculariae TaxID=2777116 RepID=A0A8S1GZN3_9PELO|nr:unnamed protein product [Caenorhabditis auriculariae]